MSLRTSATRYAKALFDVALQESDPALIERDLSTIANAMRDSGELRRALTSAGIPAHIRANIARAMVEKTDAQQPVRKLVAMLAERGRLELMPTLHEVYRERLLAHANIVRARVTSATPLDASKTSALEASLSRLTGKKVQLEVETDPSIIGGVVTQIGSTVYDGSIRTQLQKVKQQLVENA